MVDSRRRDYETDHGLSAVSPCPTLCESAWEVEILSVEGLKEMKGVKKSFS